MILRDELVCYLSQYLGCAHYQDYAPNGLQVAGRDTIRRICTAVTASAAVIEQASQKGADALLVHHGYFWRGEPAEITGMKQARIKRLLENNLNLLAYHLPLDGHPDIGNNACLAQLLQVDEIEASPVGSNQNMMWTGLLRHPLESSELAKRLNESLSREPLTIIGHQRMIKKLAWCSGAAQDFIEQAYALGADAYLSGEVSERTYYQAIELGICYYACGHHATERYGIQALGQHLNETFNLKHEFIDSANPV